MIAAQFSGRSPAPRPLETAVIGTASSLAALVIRPASSSVRGSVLSLATMTIDPREWATPSKEKGFSAAHPDAPLHQPCGGAQLFDRHRRWRSTRCLWLPYFYLRRCKRGQLVIFQRLGMSMESSHASMSKSMGMFHAVVS